jgi:hypothetical protein
MVTRAYYHFTQNMVSDQKSICFIKLQNNFMKHENYASFHLYLPYILYTIKKQK